MLNCEPWTGWLSSSLVGVASVHSVMTSNESCERFDRHGVFDGPAPNESIATRDRGLTDEPAASEDDATSVVAIWRTDSRLKALPSGALRQSPPCRRERASAITSVIVRCSNQERRRVGDATSMSPSLDANPAVVAMASLRQCAALAADHLGGRNWEKLRCRLLCGFLFRQYAAMSSSPRSSGVRSFVATRAKTLVAFRPLFRLAQNLVLSDLTQTARHTRAPPTESEMSLEALVTALYGVRYPA